MSPTRRPLVPPGLRLLAADLCRQPPGHSLSREVRLALTSEHAVGLVHVHTTSAGESPSLSVTAVTQCVRRRSQRAVPEDKAGAARPRPLLPLERGRCLLTSRESRRGGGWRRRRAGCRPVVARGRTWPGA